MKTHPYSGFFDLKSLSTLRRLGIQHLIGALPLSPEADLQNKTIPADVYWVWFVNSRSFTDDFIAEGKLYIPHRQKVDTTLIHYSPSGPVGNAGRFERRYIAGLVSAGYYVFTGRRNGASLLTQHAQEVINSPERIELAQKCNQSHVGGFRSEGYTPTDALNEPVATLSGLHLPFRKICLLSQSFGASMHYQALTRLRGHTQLLDKLGNVVNIAGYVGKYIKNEHGLWDGAALPAEQFIGLQVAEMRKAGFNYHPQHGAPEFTQSMAEVARGNEMIKVPDNVGHVFFNCVEDPFIAGPSDQHVETLRNYGPTSANKLFISMHAPMGDLRPHSMDFLTVEELIKALEKKITGVSFENR